MPDGVFPGGSREGGGFPHGGKGGAAGPRRAMASRAGDASRALGSGNASNNVVRRTEMGRGGNSSIGEETGGRTSAGRWFPEREKDSGAGATRAENGKKGAGNGQKDVCPIAGRWFFRDARDGRGICRLGIRCAKTPAPGNGFWGEKRILGLDARAALRYNAAKEGKAPL